MATKISKRINKLKTEAEIEIETILATLANRLGIEFYDVPAKIGVVVGTRIGGAGETAEDVINVILQLSF